MFLTTVKLHVQPTKRQEIMQTLQELSSRMKNDEGCVKAELYQNIDDKDTLYFLEEWQAGSKHEKSKFCAVLRGMESLLIESLEITRATSI